MLLTLVGWELLLLKCYINWHQKTNVAGYLEAEHRTSFSIQLCHILTSHPHIIKMTSETLLFSTDLVSPKVQEALPEGYTFRPLYRSDFKNGHLDILRDLAHVGEISEKDWTERFDFMVSCKGTYYVLVIADASGKLVGTGTLMVEKKLCVCCRGVNLSLLIFVF